MSWVWVLAQPVGTVSGEHQEAGRAAEVGSLQRSQNKLMSLQGPQAFWVPVSKPKAEALWA